MAERRTLTFSSLDDVMPDVDRLLLGHRTAGNWTLGQICSHLGAGMRGAIDGFGVRAPWLIRITLGKSFKRKVLSTGKMDEGIKLPENALPKPGLDARAEAEALRATIGIFKAHAGPFVDHPMFGPLTRDEWMRLHMIHCAHHLSFVWPNEGG